MAGAVLTTEHYYLPDRENGPRYGGERGRIADELADIPYCVLRLADHYDVDLEKAHLTAREAECRYYIKRGCRPGPPSGTGEAGHSTAPRRAGPVPVDMARGRSAHPAIGGGLASH